MFCTSCGRQVDDRAQSCPFCGAALRQHTGALDPVQQLDDDEWTTVLTDDYSDFRDTVVDQVIAFDPSAFEKRATEPVQAPPAEEAPAGTPAGWVAPRAAATSAGNAAVWVSPDAAAGSQATSAPAGSYAAGGYVAGNTAGGYVSGGLGSSYPTASATTAGLPTGSMEGASGQQSYYGAPGANAQAPAGQASYASVAPTSAPAPSAYNAPAAPAAKAKRSDKLFIGGIAGLAVVAVVALVGVFVALQPPASSQDSAPAAVVSAGSERANGGAAAATSDEAKHATGADADDEASSESAATADSASAVSSEAEMPSRAASPTVIDESNNHATSEQKAYEELSDYYRLAGEYDGRIAACADEFNNNYTKEDKGLRSAKAATAASLKQSVKSSWDALERMELPFMSQYTEAREQLCELYECLWHRIEVIDRAWQISLKYDKPADHQEEIIAPLKADQSGGQNKYYLRFRDLYPKIDIEKP